MIIQEPKLYKGDIFVDDRGVLEFNNELDLSGIKRMYTVTNHVPGFIRAWHGHEKEAKFFTMLSGSAIVAAVHMILNQNKWELNWDIKYKAAISADVPMVYHIPAGYANGFKLLTPGAKLLVLSTSNTEESKLDDIRFPVHGNTHHDPFAVVER